MTVVEKPWRTPVFVSIPPAGSVEAKRKGWASTSGPTATTGSWPSSTANPRYSGYQGFVHGGVVSSLLDGAMTSVLMARGETSLTADLQVRFLEPVVVGQPAVVRAWLQHSRRRLSLLEAEIRQGTHLRATARARFLDRRRDDHGLVGSRVEDSPFR